jgi:hypothetical protein
MLHSAYSFSLAFKETLVAELLERFADRKYRIIDPFCGTGTTILESKIKGISSVGVDANPICVEVSKAKTNWTLNVGVTRQLAQDINSYATSEYNRFVSRKQDRREKNQRYQTRSDEIFDRSPIGRYLLTGGLLRRGWISSLPALKTLLLVEGIASTPEQHRHFLFMSLFGVLVPDISNMSYGPEIYKKRTRTDADVFRIFSERVEQNLNKLELLRSTYSDVPTKVIWADSTDTPRLLKSNSIDLAISSPPYLSDHDYSRITRLELVFSGYVSSRDDLRNIKKRLLRSSSKNVYRDDNLRLMVKRFGEVQRIIKTIEERADGKTSGFARVYPRLVGEYFGGMYRHFRTLSRVLRINGRAAYVVGDQSSFFATPIPTARLITQVAEGCGGGFSVESMEPLKKLRGTKGNVSWSNSEWLLVLKKTKSVNVN